MKILIGTLIVFSALTSTNAQLSYITSLESPNWSMFITSTQLISAGEEEFHETKGSQLLYEEFHPATFKLKNNDKVYAVKYFRYDVHNNAVEIYANNKLFNLKVEVIQEFEISTDGNKRAFVSVSEILGDESHGFLEKIYTGNDTRIFLKHEVNTRILRTSVPYQTSKDQIVYHPRKLTFIQYEGEVYEVYNRKDLRAFLPVEMVNSEKIRPKDLENEDFLRTLGARIASI